MTPSPAEAKRHLRGALLHHWRSEPALRISDALVSIPDFRGSADAAARLAAEPVFQRAQVLLVSLAESLLVLRRLALEAGKSLVAPGPGGGFLLVDPGAIPAAHRDRAADRDGFPRFARTAAIEALPAVELVAIGAVAVDVTGGRLGDGSGDVDLAYALLREAGKVSVKTPIAVLVHSRQVVERPLPMEPFDVPVDLIITPDSKVMTRSAHPRPAHPVREG